MISAVDTNVLLDVLNPDPRFVDASIAALDAAAAQGPLIIGEVVCAELFGAGLDQAGVQLAALQLQFVPSSFESASAAGKAWRQYKDAGGPRTRVIADFLVGAHALFHAARLISRDRGFFAKYFKDLTVIDPK